MRTANDNEQIELDNFKADYFDANVTGKSAFIFRSFFPPLNPGSKKFLCRRSAGSYFAMANFSGSVVLSTCPVGTTRKGRKFASLLRSLKNCQSTCQLRT